MAVKIRMTRFGRKKLPFYRIVVTDSRNPRDGRYIECIGTYNPLNDPVELKLEQARVSYWLDQGAQPSDTVRNLFKNQGILFKRNLKKRGFEDAQIEEELKKWELLQADRSKKKTEKIKLKKSAKKAAAEEAKKEKEEPKKEEAKKEEAPPKPAPAETKAESAATQEEAKA